VKPYYEHGGITIYHCDCRDYLPTCAKGSFDLCLTDPPYGIGISNKNLGSVPNSRKIFGDWDEQRVSAFAIGSILRVAKHSVISGGNYYADLLPPTQGWLVWDKRGDDLARKSYADCEIAWTSLDRAARMYKCRWDGFIKDSDEPRNDHPTPKPLV